MWGHLLVPIFRFLPSDEVCMVSWHHFSGCERGCLARFTWNSKHRFLGVPMSFSHSLMIVTRRVGLAAKVYPFLSQRWIPSIQISRFWSDFLETFDRSLEIGQFHTNRVQNSFFASNRRADGHENSSGDRELAQSLSSGLIERFELIGASNSV